MIYSGSAFVTTESAVYTRLFVAAENSLETKLGWGAAFLKRGVKFHSQFHDCDLADCQWGCTGVREQN